MTEQATPKRILVISQYFHPEEFRINDICREWTARGHQVTVVTGIPNYPAGRFFDGYGLFKKRNDQFGAIKIHRLPIIPRGKSSVTLALNYLSFVVSGFFWSLLTTVQADTVFIFEVSPMTQALPGVWFAKRRKIPCSIYVQDLWPENVEIITGLKNRHILGLIGRMVDSIYRRCDKIFTTSQSFFQAIAARGVPADKIIVWPQYAETYHSDNFETTIPEIPVDGRLNIVFAGNIGYAQGLDILPQTAGLLQKKAVAVRFNIIGDGRYKETLVNQVRDNQLDAYFNFIDRQPASRIPQMLAANDAAFLSLAPSKLFSMTIPAKLQTYLAAGIPVIAAADGESMSIIESARAGFCGPAGDAAALAENIIRLARSTAEERAAMAQNARAYCQEHFDKNQLLDTMEQYLWSSSEKETIANV